MYLGFFRADRQLEEFAALGGGEAHVRPAVAALRPPDHDARQRAWRQADEVRRDAGGALLLGARHGRKRAELGAFPGNG